MLPAELLQYGLAGDFAVTVQPTTDMPLEVHYIAATAHSASQVELGEGELRNYVAGLPFPLIDPHDPRAGEKVAWNLRYQDEGESKQYWSTNEHRTGSGSVERSERFYSIVQHGLHRPAPADNPAAWGKLGVYTKRYNLMLGPADLEGTQALDLPLRPDTRLSDKWIYDPKSRRTRKVVDNPYEAPGNGELLAEDIWGFYGYLHAYEWTYRGDQVVLAPGPIQAVAPTWGGHGNWYPVIPGNCGASASSRHGPRGLTRCTAAACCISTCRPISCSTPLPMTIPGLIGGRLSMCITTPRLTPGTIRRGFRNMPRRRPWTISGTARGSFRSIRYSPIAP